MSAFFDSLMYSWKRGRVYGQNLGKSIPADKYTAQPLPSMNHAAWLFGHLNLYFDDMVTMLSGDEFKSSEKDPRFKPGSTPIDDLAAYPSKDELLAAWELGHERVLDALAAASDDIIEMPTGVEVLPTRGSMLVHLMIDHEWQHLGQLSALRRAMGICDS